MIRCEKHLVSKTERSANQSEGCDARRKAREGRQLHFALQPSSTMRKCAGTPQKGSRCGVMEKCMGVAFPGTTITLPLREAAG